jgi:hypothetical protein
MVVHAAKGTLLYFSTKPFKGPGKWGPKWRRWSSEI